MLCRPERPQEQQRKTNKTQREGAANQFTDQAANTCVCLLLREIAQTWLVAGQCVRIKLHFADAKHSG